MPLTNNMYKATLSSNQDTYNTKYIIISPKPDSNNDMQTTQNPSSIGRIKGTLELNELWRIKSNN